MQMTMKFSVGRTGALRPALFKNIVKTRKQIFYRRVNSGYFPQYIYNDDDERREEEESDAEWSVVCNFAWSLPKAESEE